MSVTLTTSGPNAPASGTNDSSIGTQTWTSPENIETSDNSSASVALTGQTSYYLRAQNFLFSIPGHATINGIKVEVEKRRSAGTGTLADYSVRLVRNGIISGLNRASMGSAWTASDAFSTYGNLTDDTWGLSWNIAQINDLGFGVVFACQETTGLNSATAAVDFVRVTIAYTPGVDSSPQVQTTSEVYLFGHRFPLAREQRDGGSGRVHETLATSFPPKIITNQDYGRDSNPIMSTYSVDDLRGGLGHFRYRYDDQGHIENLNCYWTGTGDGFWKGSMTLPPLATSISKPASVSLVRCMNIFQNGSAVMQLIVPYDQVLYNYNLATDTWSGAIDTLPGTPCDTAIFNARVFWAQGSAGYGYQTNAASVETDVGVGAGNPTAGVQTFIVWDNKIYAMGLDYKLYSSTSGSDASWTALATIPVPTGAATNYPQLEVYDDANGEPVIWCITQYGVYSYDATNDKWFASRFQYPYYARRQDLRQAGTPFRSSLYVRTGDREIWRLTSGGGALQVAEASLGAPDGIYAPNAGAVTQMVSDNRFLFAGHSLSFDNTSAHQSVYATAIDVGDLPSWHNLYDLAGGSAIIAPSSLLIGNTNAVGSTGRHRLFFGDYDASSGHIVRYIDLDMLARNPLTSTARQYATSGNFELPVFDGGYDAQLKVAQQIRIKVSGTTGASDAQTVQVSYRLNSSTGSYTSLGNPVCIDGETVIPLGTGNVGLAFHSIQWKWTLARGSTATSRPVVEVFNMDYRRLPEVARGFTVALDLSREYQNQSPEQMRDIVWNILGSTAAGTLAFRDDADNLKSYLVTVLKVDAGSFETGYDTRGIVTLQLFEQGPN